MSIPRSIGLSISVVATEKKFLMAVLRLAVVLLLFFCAATAQGDSLPKGASDGDKKLKQLVAEKLAGLVEYTVAYLVASVALRWL